MVTDGDPAPAVIDTSRAHPARVYDYWLGGKDNFAANRKFLARAVRYLTGEAGVRQFLDIGTGIPAADNTHQVAQREAPESRIVFWLGGKDNFAADREAAELALQAYPQLAQAVQANRKFLARAVRYLTGEAGVRQFLDIGTGIPAADNTH